MEYKKNDIEKKDAYWAVWWFSVFWEDLENLPTYEICYLMQYFLKNLFWILEKIQKNSLTDDLVTDLKLK